MRVTSFIGPNSTWAFTGDEEGSNLPTDKGTWQKYKKYNMHRGQHLKIAVDADWVIDAVTAGGYYLTAAPSAQKNCGNSMAGGARKANRSANAIGVDALSKMMTAENWDARADFTSVAQPGSGAKAIRSVRRH